MQSVFLLKKNVPFVHIFNCSAFAVMNKLNQLKQIHPVLLAKWTLSALPATVFLLFNLYHYISTTTLFLSVCTLGRLPCLSHVIHGHAAFCMKFKYI